MQSDKPLIWKQKLVLQVFLRVGTPARSTCLVSPDGNRALYSCVHTGGGYFQYPANLSSTDPSKKPILDEVQLSFNRGYAHFERTMDDVTIWRKALSSTE